MFHEEETRGGHDRSVWGTSILLYGPLQGELCTASFRRMHRHLEKLRMYPIDLYGEGFFKRRSEQT